jgi:hypothetical protein
MADYRSPTVVQQMIPVSDMTSLEHLLLTNIFDAERPTRNFLSSGNYSNLGTDVRQLQEPNPNNALVMNIPNVIHYVTICLKSISL